MSADALPTAQIDGVAWTQAIVGRTVFVGGDFKNARPAGVRAGGAGSVPRSNLMAYNLDTGALTAWAPQARASQAGTGPNGAVRAMAVSPDGRRLYVAGEFTSIDGQPRGRIAAFRTVDQKLDPSFNAQLTDTVTTLAATDDGVFAGGTFGKVNGLAQSNVVKLDATGAVVPGWRPRLDGSLRAMVVAPGGSRLVIGGSFRTVNDQPNPGMAAVDASSGQVLPWSANRFIRNYGEQAGITSLTTDGSAIYGTAFGFLKADRDPAMTDANFEGVFAADPSTGELRWAADCLGDTHSAAVARGNVFIAGHPHDCEAIRGFPEAKPAHYHSLAFTTAATTTNLPYSPALELAGRPAPGLLNWFPRWTSTNYTGQWQGPWHVTTDGTYLAYGGEFGTVNGVPQQGLVRFTQKHKSAAMGPAAAISANPVAAGREMRMIATAIGNDRVKISWQANWDPDDSTLEYALDRNGSSLSRIKAASNFYDRPGVGYVDTLATGASARYRVGVRDDPTDATAATVGQLDITMPAYTPDGYAPAVLADSPVLYWRLHEQPGTVAAGDTARWNNGLPGDGVTFARPGAIPGSQNRSAGLAGNADSFIVALDREAAPTMFTTEAWVRTTSTKGGKVIGFANRQKGTSTIVDRDTWFRPGGQLSFSVFDRSPKTIVTKETYNDGAWHHVVSSLGPAGMQLWVDGELAAANPAQTTGREAVGWWRAGADTTREKVGQLAGDIDEVAVYRSQLAPARIAAHRDAAALNR